jgi:hypothetical protein
LSLGRETLPPLGFLSAEHSPSVPVRFMFSFVATACKRLATAPADTCVTYSTTMCWSECVMERVMRGRVRKVQVRLQRRACCAVRCSCVFDACCSKRWMIFRYAAPLRSHPVKCIAFYHFLSAAPLTFSP